MGKEKRRRKFFPNSNNGFTLLELTVVFAVMILVTGVVGINFRSANDDLALDRIAYKTTQDIRKTAERAIQTEQANPCSGADTVSGYGIRFIEGAASYDIYANCNGTSKPGYDPGTDEIVKTIALENSVTIQSVDGTPVSGLWSGSVWTLAFFPPDPMAVLCTTDSCPAGSNNRLVSASVVLGNGIESKTITANKGGFTDIQ